jgi:hypothetical protein
MSDPIIAALAAKAERKTGLMAVLGAVPDQNTPEAEGAQEPAPVPSFDGGARAVPGGWPTPPPMSHAETLVQIINASRGAGGTFW